MPTEQVPMGVGPDSGDAIASRRILRLALGTSLSLGFSQVMAWDLSFIAPVVAMSVLATPFQAPGLKAGIGLVLALIAPAVIGSYLLLPFIVHLHSVAILLVAAALFHSFYLTARGTPAVVGTFLTIGITLNVAIGSVSIDAVSSATWGLAVGAVAGIVFVWMSHAVLPDRSALRVSAREPRPQPSKPPARIARRKALRSLAVVLPVAIGFLFSAASASYIVVMVKVASMGQEAEAVGSRHAGRSLIASTVWGGIGAVVGWQLLSVWPSVVFYTLLIAIAALLYGRRVFLGAGMHAKGSMWSYAFLTMIILLAPAALDGAGGSAAGAAFWSRLSLVGIAALYGSLAVTVFDSFWPARKDGAGQAEEASQPV